MSSSAGVSDGAGDVLRDGPKRRNRAVAIAAACAVVGTFALADRAPAAQAATELPPVTISSTTLHDGDTITISGTGCVDPDTGSGDGLEVVLVRPGDFGRGGIQTNIATVHADAGADGTFQGSGVVDQPLFPDGPHTGLFSCQETDSGEDGYSSVFRSREVDLEIVAPSLPDLTVAAGSTFDYTLPCSIDGGEYGRFGFDLHIAGTDAFDFGVPGTFPYDTSPKEGERVSLTVPTDTPPGTYGATASCSVSEAGTSAYFSGFTVTVLGATTAAPSPSPAPAPAAAADPVAGSPDFTG